MPFINSVRGSFSPNGRSRNPFNLATGGSVVSDIVNYNSTQQTWRVHQFNNGGPTSFNVISNQQAFKVLVVAAGSAGAPMDHCAGNGGAGGGVVVNDNVTLLIQNYSVTVGAGAGGPSCAQPAGGPSTFAGITASPNAGAGGGAAYVDPGAGSVGGAGGTGTGNSITGGLNYYGSGGGGGGGIGSSVSANGPGTYGLGGHGGCWSDNPTRGSGGNSGIVIVAYRIA